MSKGSLFWANASGKLGETVLYRSGGEQRTRTYVAKIKNPKTLAQMKNRLSMLNLATIYRLLKPILSVSFPLRKANQSGFNAFVKANKSISTAVISKEMAQNNMVVPYNMLMSEGVFNPLGSYKSREDGYNGYDVKSLLTEEVLAQFPITTGTGFAKIDTAEKLKALVLALGLPASVKFTIVRSSYMDDGFDVSSYTIDSTATDAQIAAAGLYLNAGEVVLEDGQSLFGQDILLSPQYQTSGEVISTLILSYKDGNGVLQISTSRMLVESTDDSYVEQYLEGGEVYEQVLDAYGYNVGSALE